MLAHPGDHEASTWTLFEDFGSGVTASWVLIVAFVVLGALGPGLSRSVRRMMIVAASVGLALGAVAALLDAGIVELTDPWLSYGSGLMLSCMAMLHAFDGARGKVLSVTAVLGFGLMIYAASGAAFATLYWRPSADIFVLGLLVGLCGAYACGSLTLRGKEKVGYGLSSPLRTRDEQLRG